MTALPVPEGRTLLVAVKHVPVGGSQLRVVDGSLTREGVSHGLDPINEVALEWALQAKEAGLAARVVAVTMGPVASMDSLRRALSMGADEAVLVCDPTLAGADLRTTAQVLAAVSRKVDASLLLTGYESVDGSSGAVPAAAAALLDWPLLSRFSRGQLLTATVRGERDLGSGAESVEASLPAVLSVVEGYISPRYPKLRDVLRTKNTQATTYIAAELGVNPTACWETTELVDIPHAPKESRVLTLDEGIRELFALITAGASLD
jgi:electron transfer flavoprotein beta subunit